jgi:hypothetical protein
VVQFENAAQKTGTTKLSRTLITEHSVFVVEAFAASPPEPGQHPAAGKCPLQKADSVLSIASRYYQQVADFFNNLQGISH